MKIRDFLSFKDRSFEERIFLKSMGIAFVTMFLLTINVGIHGLVNPILIFDITSTVILFLFFYSGYRWRIYRWLILPSILTILILIDLSWFMSSGYTGPNGYFLLLLLIITLIISKKNERYVYTTLFVFNAVALFIIEYQNPSLSVHYPFEIDLVGQGIILIITLFTASAIVVQLRNAYDHDRTRIIKMNDQLTEHKAEIEQKNMELEQYSERLEHEVAMKTKKLESLNADLREQNTSLEQFTYILSHNIKSPITQLKGLFSLLPDKISHEKAVSETFSRMKDSTYKLGDVIQDLSKIIDVRKNSNDIFETVSIIKQLMLAKTTLEGEIKASNAEIDISRVEDVSVKGINAYILSIFYNLIHNAIKYADIERRPKIEVSAIQVDENVIIKVSDNGIGIDMGHAKDRIFQLYQRLNNERDGKGFGLYLIKTQVKTMGGEIQVESDLGQGTTFTISLPASDS